MFKWGSYRLPVTATAPFCPSQVTQTIPVPLTAGLWARFRRYMGIGFLVSVGYMDPGNWATDIEAGSRFGYTLLCVVLVSGLIGMVLQSLCVRLGIGSGQDIAQLCRERFSKHVVLILWLLAQIAIIACDFAEVLGTALSLKLLFHLPLAVGIILTAFDTLIVLALQGTGELRIETIVMGLVGIIAVIFAIEMVMSKPDWHAVAVGLWPHVKVFKEPHALWIAVGILGATVMPHNLYLHSSAVGSRKLIPGQEARSDAIRLLTWDTVITLTLALLVNAAILIVSASVFHRFGHHDVASIDDAYYLLAPLVGASCASVLFALALFASGQSSTLTGTMAGQVILEGFLNLRIPCWQQRLFTRLCAIAPAWFGIMILGEAALGKLLVMSQVVLSLQLPFAMVPLVLFCNDAKIMGSYRIGRMHSAVCWVICAVIIAANLFLIYDVATGG